MPKICADMYKTPAVVPSAIGHDDSTPSSSNIASIGKNPKPIAADPVYKNSSLPRVIPRRNKTVPKVAINAQTRNIFEW